MMLRTGATGGLCVALFELGCAAIVDFPADPQLVAQAALTAEAGWRCLGDLTEPPSPSAPTARVRAMACDALRGCSAPVTGLTARVCSKIDLDCSTPLIEGLHDVGGVFEFDVPTTIMGFDGYLEVSSSAEPCTSPAFGETSPLVCTLVPECDPQAPDASCNVPVYPRFLHFFNPPITEDASEPALITLLPMAGLLGIVGATGSSFDATTGILILTARDCDSAPAAGVEYELEGIQFPTSALYMDNGVLSDVREATDASGIGGFVGVPRGYSNVGAYAASGARIGGVGVQIAPGSITNVTLIPSP